MEILASKLRSLVTWKIMENTFGRWRELGNGPALQFYNEAINAAPESDAALIAEQKVAELRAVDEK